MLPGNDEVSPSYTRELKKLIASLPSRESIELMGKVKEKLGSADANSSSDINSLDMYKFRI